MSLPSLHPSQDSFNSSMKCFWCHWNWCSQSFSNEKDLAQHVIREHVRLAVRIDRHDIPMHRRAEDGYGSTLAFSGISEAITEKPMELNTMELNTSKEANTYVVDQEPLSSLPSPPVSSPPLRMHTLPDVPGPVQPHESSNPSNNSRSQSLQQNSNILPAKPPNHLFYSPSGGQDTFANGSTRVLTNFAIPMTPPSRPPRSIRAQTLNPTFASLSSPLDAPVLASIPGSPSFNSLVDDAINSRKRKDRSGEPESVIHKRIYNAKDSCINPSQSQSSTASRDSVARILTQNTNNLGDVDIDAVGEIDEEALFTLSHNMDHKASEEDINQYSGELNWEEPKQRSKHTPLREPSVPSSSNPSIKFPLESLSQPPSQLQAHSQSVQPPDSIDPSQLTLDTSLPLGSIAPLQSPGFASSTPRQAWYQPVPIHKPRRRTSEHPGGLVIPPLSEGANSPPPNMFRSGTLHIIPPRMHSAASPEGPKDRADLQVKQQLAQQDRHQSQSQLSSSEGDSQEFSYPPLQTQAPYQSQSLSQSW